MFSLGLNGIETAQTAAAAASPPAIVLAKVLDPSVDPADYFVSEKFDGVRAIWDGEVLRFRSGNVVNAPAWFIAKLPKQSLDGELWLARETFEVLSGYVRKTDPVDEEWRQIKYQIFELPGAPGRFEERYARIQAIVKQAAWPQLVAVHQFRVSDRAELKRKFDGVVKAGGEGLMLHRADALYVTGRSDVLLKLKPLDDTEAIVVEHIPGKGKYAGMLGALRVEAPDGKRFTIGTGFTDAVRRDPPPVGSTITYTYRGLTRTGVPRFASYWRVREKF
ncbi:MAG: DNA ligase [Betaproteobacteria bacterium]|nr:DNA ligase [Betaproteobacteria bacterium]